MKTLKVLIVEDETKLAKALKQETAVGTGSSFAFDIRPYPYQQEILDKLEAERTLRHSYRNLLVAATGTGKTVIAAFDYKHLKSLLEYYFLLLFFDTFLNHQDLA